MIDTQKSFIHATTYTFSHHVCNYNGDYMMSIPFDYNSSLSLHINHVYQSFSFYSFCITFFAQYLKEDFLFNLHSCATIKKYHYLPNWRWLSQGSPNWQCPSRPKPVPNWQRSIFKIMHFGTVIRKLVIPMWMSKRIMLNLWTAIGGNDMLSNQFSSFYLRLCMYINTHTINYHQRIKLHLFLKFYLQSCFSISFATVV